MQEDFSRALKLVLVHEGGKVDDPQDPGGRTNQGVIQRTYDAYRRGKNQPLRDVYAMTEVERDEIYRAQYWDRIQGDKLPPGVGYVLFDGAVNSGVGQSVKWLQRALGLQADGVVGAYTLAAINALDDHDALISKIIIRRRAFLRALKTYKRFGRGWEKRIESVQGAGHRFAMGSVGPAVVYIPGAEAKARLQDAKTPPVRAPGDIATGVGAATATINEATGALTPLAGSSPSIASIVGLLTTAGVVVALGGIAYRAWAAARASRLKDALDLATPQPSAAR